MSSKGQPVTESCESMTLITALQVSRDHVTKF